MEDPTGRLTEEEQKEQVRRYDELHRHLLHGTRPVPPHFFLYVLQRDIPLRFPLACLLARHPSTPEDVLHYIVETSPDPECDYPYCSNSYEDRLACQHNIPIERKIFLYVNLLERTYLSSSLLTAISRLPDSMPRKMQTEVLQKIAGRKETPQTVLHDCSLHPDSDYTVLSLIMIHPNSAEEDRVIAALRLPHPTWWEKEHTEKLAQEFLTQDAEET